MCRLLMWALFYAVTPCVAATNWAAWLNQDVRWLIGPLEKQQFLALRSDNARERFQREFWNRRDPTPDSAINEAQQEHQRRLNIVNTLFSGRKPGCSTDQGHVYILYGRPDHLDDHLALIWHYDFIAGLGRDIDVRFVYNKHKGEWRLAMSKDIRAALFYQPDLIDFKTSSTLP